MRQFIRKHGFGARSVAMLAAGVLVLQIFFAGLAIASVEGGPNAYFGAICAPQNTAGDSSQPAEPLSGRRHGLCCILHSVALDAAAIRPVSALVRVLWDEVIVLTAFHLVSTLLLEPESAPQSPRAPPSASI